MSILLALAAGISLAANDGDMHLSYSDFCRLFPSVAAPEEAQAGKVDFLRIVYERFDSHIYNASYGMDSDVFKFGYSIGIGKFGNLVSGELLNLTMMQGSIISEHARFYIDYSLNTSELSADFLDGLFTLKNAFGFNAEFPFYGIMPSAYAGASTRHLLFSGGDDIALHAGAGAEYPFLRHFSISAFYEHEWNIGGNPSGIDRAGLGFVFSY